ncbi:MAG: DUF86 domain-containing protein [Flavobacteriales bacterium]|nr:DUF86 domain-containing protein [Flavobacteriales bacterium]
MLPHKRIPKLLMDIESIIDELEKIVHHHNRDFNDFSASFISVRAVERDLMIIGEAVSQIRKLDKELPISSADQIIGLRNLIVHAYDSIDPAALWRILIKDLPVLKEEVKTLKR